MASLDDLATIDENSLKEPPADPQPGDPVVAARALRRRVRLLLVRKAYNFLDNPPPAEAEALQAYNEQLALSQQIFRSPDTHLNSAMFMVLANAPASATSADILGLQDAQLNTIISPQRLALLAKGLRLG